MYAQSQLNQIYLIIFAVLIALLLRVCTSLHPYSGEGAPPMYGDYEAQRHWMEITTNLPLKQWYENTTDNDLMYWGLDYPPLTAYHMYLCGLLAGYLNPNYTKLHESRGYESPDHKLFMRYTVLLGDVLVFIPGVILYFALTVRRTQNNEIGFQTKPPSPQAYCDYQPMHPCLSTVLTLLYPGLILVDHGHFQYNSISLGLLILAVTALLTHHPIPSTVFFCLALFYKQMELYHSLPFFLYLLSDCVPKPGQSLWCGVVKLGKLAVTVLICFQVVCFPFINEPAVGVQMLHRLFPVARGVFEDKVANVWCMVNIVWKLKQLYDNTQMMRVCLFSTLLAVAPSGLDLFLYPNPKKFVLALINFSLGFFLFSYQVHEKSILLVAIPVMLYMPYAPFACFWFLHISTFSMLPLFFKDNLMIAFVALTVFYVVSFRLVVENAYGPRGKFGEGWREYYRALLLVLLEMESGGEVLRKIRLEKTAMRRVFGSVCLVVSIGGCLILFLMLAILEPPARLPDLFPLMISVYCCLHFVGFFLYFNYRQLRLPQVFAPIKNLKVKQS